jgi:hypothetical protein
MNCLHSWLLLALAIRVSVADTFDLGKPGTLTISVPDTWTAKGEAVGDQGYNITVTPKGDANAALRLTAFFGPMEAPVPDDQIQERFVARLEPVIAGSVEKKATVQQLKVGAGSGFCISLSDASLVGKPSVPGNYKVMTSGMIKPAEGVIIAVTLFTDAKDGTEFAEGIKMLESLQVSRK